MELDIFIVDAFTEQQFKGNYAAVVPVEEWLSDELMQNIAAENNLSETAFIKHLGVNSYEIRWFSPLTEIDFCGHATLASAYVLFNELGIKEKITFVTREVGSLTVIQNTLSEMQMTFPNQKPTKLSSVPADLVDGLSKAPIDVLKNRQAYFAIYESEHDIATLSYNVERLKALAPLDVVVTAKSDKYDFVSRYFWPANGGEEDPVTGSIHSGLAPYWAEKLVKQDLLAFQASKRGGVLKCRVTEHAVTISGKGVLYMKGKIYI